MAHLLVLVGYGVMIEQSAGDLGHILYGIIKTVFGLSYHSDDLFIIAIHLCICCQYRMKAELNIMAAVSTRHGAEMTGLHVGFVKVRGQLERSKIIMWHHFSV